MLVPRNGVGSGQVVLSDPAGLRGIEAAIGDLKGPAGAAIPAQAVQLRYAVQPGLLHYCDALMETPPVDAVTVPVWLIVQAPRDAAPGAAAFGVSVGHPYRYDADGGTRTPTPFGTRS